MPITLIDIQLLWDGPDGASLPLVRLFRRVHFYHRTFARAEAPNVGQRSARWPASAVASIGVALWTSPPGARVKRGVRPVSVVSSGQDGIELYPTQAPGAEGVDVTVAVCR